MFLSDAFSFFFFYLCWILFVTKTKYENWNIFDLNAKAELDSAPDVRTAATLFQSLVYNNKDRLMAGIICGGYDEHEGGSIYSIPLG